MWQYQILQLEELIPDGNLDNLQIKLNEIGEKGWELLTVTTVGFSQGIQFWIFKKQTQEFIKLEQCGTCEYYQEEGKDYGICTLSQCTVNNINCCQSYMQSGEN